MATLATQVLAHAGTAPDYADAGASGDKAPVGSGVFLQVINSDSATHTVTLPIPAQIDGETVTSRVVTIPTTGDGGTMMIPLTDVYQQSDGLAHLSYDAYADLTVAVFRVS